MALQVNLACYNNGAGRLSKALKLTQTIPWITATKLIDGMDALADRLGHSYC